MMHDLYEHFFQIRLQYLQFQDLGPGPAQRGHHIFKLGVFLDCQNVAALVMADCQWL
jgi:hypothetical protein